MKKKKVLIVDDAIFMQKVASGMLSVKYETITASSGAEALELYEKEKPDLILSDLIMPGMTGLELQQALQERYTENIPFMFMTADEREENESRGLESGAMDYIRKPFNKDVLLRRVDNIIRHVERIEGLKMVAETDPMTGLLNKACAQTTLADVCRTAGGVLMMVDLDSFKLVNDIYGHGMGDKILIRFADIIRSVIRSSDIAGRMGGDEFIVFCRDIRDEEIIADKARRINESLLTSAREFMGEDMNIPLGASIGAVAVPEEGTEFSELYRKADKALYRVKQNGKHGYAFFHGETAPAEEAARADTTNIENALMILEERNRQKGPLELGFLQFQSVYRYVVRRAETDHRSAELVLFTLSSADAAEHFSETLSNSLRRGDVFTNGGKSQYLVLLSDMAGTDDLPILGRVLEQWESSEHSRTGTIAYETALIAGGNAKP